MTRPGKYKHTQWHTVHRLYVEKCSQSFTLSMSALLYLSFARLSSRNIHLQRSPQGESTSLTAMMAAPPPKVCLAPTNLLKTMVFRLLTNIIQNAACIMLFLTPSRLHFREWFSLERWLSPWLQETGLWTSRLLWFVRYKTRDNGWGVVNERAHNDREKNYLRVIRQDLSIKCICWTVTFAGLNRQTDKERDQNVPS